MYTKATSLSNLYIRNIIPDDTDIPLLEHLALSGWGEAVFPNYVEEEFCEVHDSKQAEIPASIGDRGGAERDFRRMIKRLRYHCGEET